MMQGAARLYDAIAATPLGKETPETRGLAPTRAAMVEQLAKMMAKR
jgi:hypothetical protein